MPTQNVWRALKNRRLLQGIKQNKQAAREAALYAARCSPATAHTRLTPAVPSAPCPMNIHAR